MPIIKWDRTTNFTGRNGYMKCNGIEILKLDFLAPDVKVLLTPITSKGALARCDVTIPIESIPEIIAALQGVLK